MPSIAPRNNEQDEKPDLSWRKQYRFDVFISYSRKDADFVRRLDKALRGYAVPASLDAEMRSLRVVRDEEDLAHVEYGAGIQELLKQSAKLIVVGSPSARTSGPVADEIRDFRRAHSCRDLINERALIPLLLEGEPNNQLDPATRSAVAFPDALYAGGSVPLGTDYRGFDIQRHQVRKAPYEKSWHKLLANIFSTSQALIEDRERKKQARRRRILISVLSSALVIVSGLLVYALQSRTAAIQARNDTTQALAKEKMAREDADKQRGRAEDNQLQAERAAREARTAQGQAEERQRQATASYLAELVETKRLESPHFTELLPALAVEAGRRFRSAEIATALLDAIRIQPISVVEFRHHYGVVAVKFDPTGQVLASGSSSGLMLGDLKGSVRWRDPQWSQNRTPVCSVQALDYHPTGSEIAAGCFNSRVDLFDPTNGKVKRSLPQNNWVLAVRYSSDGAFLASSDEGKHVHIYEAGTQRQPIDVTMPDTCDAIAFHPRNAWLATGCQDGKLRLLGLSTGSITRTFNLIQQIASIDVSPDGRWIAAVTWGGKLWVYDCDQTTLESKELSREPLQKVLFAPDGRHLLTAGWDGSCRILNWNFVEIARVEHSGWVSDIAVNSTFGASAGYDGIAYVFELNSGHIVQILPHRNRVEAVAFAPTRHLIATGSLDNRAAIYTLPEDSVSWIAAKVGTEVTAARFVNGNRLTLAWRTPRSRWQWFDALTGRPLGKAAEPFGDIYALGSDREGEVISAFSEFSGMVFKKNGEAVQLRQTASADYSSMADPEAEKLAATAVSPQADAAAFGDAYGITVYELKSRNKARQLRPSPSFRVGALEFSPLGNQLAAGFATGELQVWDWKREKQTRPPLKTGLAFDQLRALAWTPDGKFLACGGDAKQLIIWNIETGHQMIRIPHAAAIRALEFTEGGRSIRSLERTGTIRTFLWRQQDLMMRACEVAPRKALEPDRWKTWVPGEPYSSTCDHRLSPSSNL